VIAWSLQQLPAILGSLLAFSCAVVSILVDCHVTLAQRLKRVPISVARTREAWLLSSACGLVALIAYRFTSNQGTTFLDTVLGLQQRNPILRGAVVGLTILVLIRSKVLSLKGADVGGEFFYGWGRSSVMRALNSRWRNYKNRYTSANLDRAFATQDFQNRLLDQLRQALQVEDEEFRVFVESQMKDVTQNRPADPVDPNSPRWKTYYRTLINLGLDYAGPAVFDWVQFANVR